MQRGLSGAVDGIHGGAVVHQDARHVHVAAARRQMQRRVPRGGARLPGTRVVKLLGLVSGSPVMGGQAYDRG